MGAALGNPISEADQARINETIQDVIKIFSVEFLKSYTQAVIEELKNEKNPPVDVEDSLQLQKAPIPSHTLLSGMLTKVRQSVYHELCPHFRCNLMPLDLIVLSERRREQELAESLLRRLQ